jgi:CDP-paratose 2-epimerase
MKVLITGVAGFLGTHVAELFKNIGFEVIGIDNLTDYELSKEHYNVSLARKHNLDFLESKGIQFLKIDCRSIVASDFVQEYPDIGYIIHCAAQPTMTLSIKDPYYDMDENIAATVNMLEIAKLLNIPFAYCSSVHVYGNCSNEMLTETPTRFRAVNEEVNESYPVLFGELTPLHVSKYSAELYCKCYHEMYGIPVAIFRLTGMYGPRQFGGINHGWVANFAIKTQTEKEIIVYGTDKQVRDILYVGDAADAFLDWYMHNCPSGTYNIGGGYKYSISINECLSKLKLITGKEQNIRLEPKRVGDMHYFVCDYQKAKDSFGWEPSVGPDIGLKLLVRWIKENEEILT